MRRLPYLCGTLHIEDIQDQAGTGADAAWRAYGSPAPTCCIVKQRGPSSSAGQQQGIVRPQQPSKPHGINVVQTRMARTGPPGHRPHADHQSVRPAKGLSDVDAGRIIPGSTAQYVRRHHGAADVATSVLITARTLVEEEPNYTYVSASLAAG